MGDYTLKASWDGKHRGDTKGVTRHGARKLPESIHTIFSLKKSHQGTATFWFLQVTSSVAFVLWIIAATFLSRFALRKVPEDFPTIHAHGKNGNDVVVTLPTDFAGTGISQIGKRISADVWFALSLCAAGDAIAVVLTFNGALIRRYHYAVSQRMMFLASVASFLVLRWNSSEPNMVTRHPILSVIFGILSHAVFSLALDKFERPLPPASQMMSWGGVQKYSSNLGLGETSWKRAVLLAASVTIAGLSLTMTIAPPWSAVVPILHILFESVFLSAMKSKRTAKYLVLCSPPFFATICVHWGVAPVAAAPKLTLSPSLFLGLLILGRLLFDLHLHTIFRHNAELQWARREVLLSTRSIVACCALMLAMEYAGILVLTYVKPIMVLGIFGVNSVGFLGVASHNIAYKTKPSLEGKVR